ncbi:PAS/PAC sensor signal transduction histidine kinase [Pelagirhabdus alkalitolerans]|uniref:histidine kinase n=1 Tax=Pelagirhabdus alkalitolerans TaxID=1612202 RepID=A0A1G6HK93_9BACI|nr:ATP-binding protein [Pelagirhabdus alkalitolerans]SDB94672.1 PAS/PAC sensor signal transduction histidine kinase [Pelagirhabdus alkalitolerans]
MMRHPNRMFILYGVVTFILFIIMTLMIVPLTTAGDQVIATLVLLGAFAVHLVLYYQVYLNYIRPVQMTNRIIDELVKGNYRVNANESFHQDTGHLAYSVNRLARHLQSLNRQEKMHSRQLRTVIDNMESGIMLIDFKGYVDLVNRKFVDLFGKTESSYHNQIYYDVMKQKNVYQVVQEAFLYEQTVKDSIIVSKDGYKNYIEIVGAPFFNESDDIRGVVLVFHDITDLKKVEEMRKDFVANVSHELKTPMTSIKGFAETLIEDDQLDQSVRHHFLSIIYNESTRLQTLIDDLLELSKIEKEGFQLTRLPVDIHALINSCLTIIEPIAEKKQIKVISRLDKKVTIHVDHDRLKQVILNLLFNAVSYTPENGEIVIDVTNQDHWFNLSIQDNGIGIPNDLKNRIFERFYRVDKARSRETGGTGLGLAIVKHIVEAHGGFIEVESELNKGSTFTVSIPD